MNLITAFKQRRYIYNYYYYKAHLFHVRATGWRQNGLTRDTVKPRLTPLHSGHRDITDKLFRRKKSMYCNGNPFRTDTPLPRITDNKSSPKTLCA